MTNEESRTVFLALGGGETGRFSRPLDVLNFTRVVAKERQIIGQSKSLEYLIKKNKPISSIEDVARINQNE